MSSYTKDKNNRLTVRMSDLDMSKLNDLASVYEVNSCEVLRELISQRWTVLNGEI